MILQKYIKYKAFTTDVYKRQTVSTTPVFVLPEEAPGVTVSDLPMSPAAKAAVEQAATIAIEATDVYKRQG